MCSEGYKPEKSSFVALVLDLVTQEKYQNTCFIYEKSKEKKRIAPEITHTIKVVEKDIILAYIINQAKICKRKPNARLINHSTRILIFFE